MKLSDNSSKLILSAALFALAGSILVVSGSGQAQGATSPTATDKAITSLKASVKGLTTATGSLLTATLDLNDRVVVLEQAPEIAKGDTGATGAQGQQGVPGDRGLTGPAGAVTGLSKKTIYFYGTSSGECGYSGFSSSLTLISSISTTKTDVNATSVFGRATSSYVVSDVASRATTLTLCQASVYAP